MKWFISIGIGLFLFFTPVNGAELEEPVTEETNGYTQEELDETTEEMNGYTQEELDETTEELLDGLGLDEIDQIVQDMLGNEEISFSEMVTKLVSGDLELDVELLTELLQEIFVKELLEQKDILLQLVLLVMVSALLMNMSHLFENGQLSNVTFYMVYLMVFVLLMRSFRGLLGQVESVLGSTSSFMKILAPAYYLAITAANGSLTAAGYYQLVLLTITLVQWILLNVALPGVQIYVILGVVNYISQEDYLSKMADLIQTVVVWLTKTVTAVIVGMQVLQRMVAPAIDMVKRGLIGKTASAIPGIGNVLDSVTEMTVGCAILVRNCMGAVALIVLIIFGLAPIIQLGLTTLLYRLVAAVVQPVSEKRLVKAISVMGEGCALLFRILLTAQILFLLTIAIVASGGME